MPQRSTVYIVDDDQAVRESLVAYFESVGIDARAFSSGNEFLDASIPCRSGCVFLDLRMPGKNGIDVLKQLRKSRSGNPVIVITSDVEPKTRREALLAGAFAIVEKPFLAQELLDAMHQALARG